MMLTSVFEIAALRNVLNMKVKYLWTRKPTKAGGKDAFYYMRGVPVDVQGFYRGANIKVALEANSLAQAAHHIAIINRMYEAEWDGLRNGTITSPRFLDDEAKQLLKKFGIIEGRLNDESAFEAFFDHLEALHLKYSRGDERVYHEANLEDFLKPTEYRALEIARELAAPADETNPRIKEMMQIYLKHHPRGQQKKLIDYTGKVFGWLVDSIGDKRIKDITRADANTFVTKEFAKGVKRATVKRRINVVRAAINRVILELGLRSENVTNQFESLSLGAETPETASEKRLPFPKENLKKALVKAREIDDDKRRVFVLMAHTGMRLAECAGLLATDVHIEEPIPYLDLVPHSHRGLKTASSARTIPLVGESLEIVKKALTESPKGHLFPSCSSDAGVKSNSLSQGLCKWAKKASGFDKASNHGLRHTVEDNLRNAGVDKEIREQLLGHARQGMEARYGLGHSLEIKRDALLKADALVP